MIYRFLRGSPIVSCVKPQALVNRGLQIVSNVRGNVLFIMTVLYILLILSWSCCSKEMESKCLFQSRADSHCAECCTALMKLSSVPEHEIIINRCCLPLDLSSNQLDRLWICGKHKDAMTKDWRPRQTCQHPLHSGPKKKLTTRNVITAEISKEIDTIYGKRVPIGSRK